MVKLRLPWWSSGKESACQCREHRFDPWARKIPHTTQPMYLQLLGNLNLEPISATRRATAVGALHIAEGERPPFAVTSHGNENPAHPKINKFKYIYIVKLISPVFFFLFF